MAKLNRSKPLNIKGKAPAKRSAVLPAAKSRAKTPRPRPTKNTEAAKNRARNGTRAATKTTKSAKRTTPAKPSKPVKIIAKKPPAKRPATKAPAARVGKSVVPKTVPPATVAANGKKIAMKTAGNKAVPIVLPDGYRPADSEAFMNAMHRVYFRKKLLQWKEDIILQNRETLHVLHEDTGQHADLADRATSETDRALELRSRDRQRKLVAKIDSALQRIEDGSYGYCVETGEPISLKRLDARPIATLSLEAQERHERRERVYREE